MLGRNCLILLMPTHCLVYDGLLKSSGKTGGGRIYRCDEFGGNFDK